MWLAAVLVFVAIGGLILEIEFPRPVPFSALGRGDLVHILTPILSMKWVLEHSFPPFTLLGTKLERAFPPVIHAAVFFSLDSFCLATVTFQFI